MKLTESMLRQIVQEELEAMLSEEEKDEEVDHAAELKGRIEKSQKERGIHGKADTGRNYLKRLMKSASKKGSS